MKGESEERPVEEPSSNQFDLAFLSALGSLVKWSLASLLLINGGALIALINLEERGAYLLKASGLYFIAGLQLAIWSGVMIGVFIMQMINLERVMTGRSSDVRKPSLLAITALYLAVFTLVGSIFAFTVGAFKVGDALESQASKAPTAPTPAAT